VRPCKWHKRGQVEAGGTRWLMHEAYEIDYYEAGATPPPKAGDNKPKQWQA